MVQVKLWKGPEVDRLEAAFNQWSKDNSDSNIISVSMFAKGDQLVLGVYFVKVTPAQATGSIVVPNLKMNPKLKLEK